MYLQHGLRHRINGPALLYQNGTRLWHQYGRKYRKDKPAIIYANGLERWCTRLFI
jgi:hypothetical protein